MSDASLRRALVMACCASGLIAAACAASAPSLQQHALLTGAHNAAFVGEKAVALSAQDKLQD